MHVAAEAATLFVGRATEQEALGAQIARARAGAPAVVVLEGPSGMGKTALVHRALQGAPDFRVLAATADESESSLAGGVVDRLMAAVGGGDELQPIGVVEASADPFATGARLLGLLGRLQGYGPVAVVVDDCQWADRFSVQALAFALRRLQRDQVLAIFVARDQPPGLPDSLRRLADGERGVTLRLHGLDPSELAELGSAVTGQKVSRRAAERLCAHTSGNPLHALALLEELGEGALPETDGVLPAPRSFAMVIAARLAACAPETVSLVQAAAVLGQRCAVGTAAAIGGVADPLGAIDEAVAAHLMDLLPRCEVAFVHPLVRAAVYHDLGPSRRVALHARAAAVVDGPAALFHRVAATLVEDPALADEVEAYARQELTKGAVDSGADALLAAARLTDDPARRATLVLDTVEALLDAGDVARATVVAKDVVAFADSARGQYVLGHLALACGRHKDAEAFLIEAWALRESQQEGLGGLVAADMAQICTMQLRSAEAAEWARRAIEASTDPELTASALSVLVPCLGRSGRPCDALGAATAVAQEGPVAPGVHLEALLGRGMVRLWVDDLEEARHDLAAVVAACRHRPASRPALVALGMLADTEYRLGAWDDSVVHAAQVVSLVEDSEQVCFGAFAHAAATWVLAPRGEFARAKAHAHAAAQAGRVLGDAASLGCAATAAAHVAFFQGEMGDAVRAVQPMLELGDRAADDEPSVHPWRELHIEALLRLGRLEEAESALRALETLAASRQRRSSLAHAARLRAELDATRGHHDTARAGFDVALSRVRELGTPFELARTQEAFGSYLRRRGHRRAAADHLQAAQEVYLRVGARPSLERAEREWAACGLEPSPRSGQRSSDLTPQELAVARLVANGHTNREVAAELIVSPKTVEYHLGHVYAKLGLRSRAQLAARLAATGA